MWKIILGIGLAKGIIPTTIDVARMAVESHNYRLENSFS